MNRRGVVRRLEGLEGRVGRGGRFLKVEFYSRQRDGTLVRLPESDDAEAERTIRVVFPEAAPEGDGGPEPEPEAA